MHDRNGTPLGKGDKVLIEATITDTYATLDWCNVTVALHDVTRPNEADNVHSNATLNTRQVVLFRKAGT